MSTTEATATFSPPGWPSPTVLSLVIAVLVTLLYSYLKRPKKETWDQYGVPCPKLSPSYFLLSDDYRVQVSALLNEHGSSVGLNLASSLSLITTDFEILRNIMIKDFNNFVNRAGNMVTSSPIGTSIFFAKDDAWRRQRHIVSPTFTTGKLKHISKSVIQSANDLANYLELFAKNGTVVPVKDTCGRYTAELIAKTGFGLNASFIGQEDAEFYKYGKNMIYTRNDFIGKLRFFLRYVPRLANKGATVFKIQFFDRINLQSHRYFDATLRKTISERRLQKQQGVEKSYPDFLDLILKANDALAQGKAVEGDESAPATSAERPSQPPLSGLTDEEMLGLSMLIIFAGLETTATTLQMCLYELAMNPDIQGRVYTEIQEVMTSETPAFEDFGRLTYTEQVINETLRLYGPLPTVNRVAREKRTYGGITIPKGSTIMIPIFHIHMDPNIYPDPQKFDPDRFSLEEKQKRDPLAFMPFGQGPRICLGMRLAYLELKAGLVYVLRKVKVVMTEDTQPKIGEEKVRTIAQELLTPVKPILLAFELRSKEDRS